ncbi:hypothetical protein BH11CYA1_BH11CYA1_12860 [soil metagenome]
MNRRRLDHQIIIAISICLLGYLLYQCQRPVRAAEALKPNSEHEWIIRQTHKDLGKTKISFAKNAIKIFNESWGYTVLSKAPDWSVVIYRDDDKIEWKISRNQFYKTYPVDLKGMPTNHIGLQRSRAADTTGAKSWSYLMGGQTFWFAEQFKAATEVDATISAYYGIRPQKGILTKYALTFGEPKTKESSWLSGFQRSGYVEYLITLSYKELPYNAKDFAAPVGYKTAKDPYTITTSKAQKESGDEAMRELGLGEKLGH